MSTGSGLKALISKIEFSGTDDFVVVNIGAIWLISFTLSLTLSIYSGVTKSRLFNKIISTLKVRAC